MRQTRHKTARAEAATVSPDARLVSLGVLTLVILLLLVGGAGSF